MKMSVCSVLLLISSSFYFTSCTRNDNQNSRAYLEDCSVFYPDRPRHPTPTKSPLENTETEKQLKASQKRVKQLESENRELKKKVKTLLDNVGEWKLGSQEAFSLEKVLGVWYRIQQFRRSNSSTVLNTCEEYEFRLTWTTIHVTNRWGKSDEKKESKFSFTVDTPSPHLWTGGSLWKWLKTDYDNWGVLTWCANKNNASCQSVSVLSRKRTLSQMTLENLRIFAEERKFPKENGHVYNQTSC